MMSFRYFYKGKSIRSSDADLAGNLLLHLLLTLPLVLAIIWLILPAFGIHPGLDLFRPGLAAFSMFLSEPGIVRSLIVSLSSAILATLGSIVLALLIVVHLSPKQLVEYCRPWLAFMLALPHLTVVVGIQFFVSPSGWMTRIAAQYFGWDIPPSINTVPDAWNIGYILLLMVKESGFILMLIIAQLDHLPVHRHYRIGTSFGYSLPYVWLKILLPQIYPKIRLGLWVLFVFAATNVEIALFASPNSMVPFSVRIWQWFTDSSLDTQLLACAGSLIFFLLVSLSLFLFFSIEYFTKWLGRFWLVSSSRGVGGPSKNSLVFWYILLGLHILPFISMLIWSFSMSWRFPDILPTGLTSDYWLRSDVFQAIANSLLIGTIVATFSVASVIAFSELSKKRLQSWQIWLFYAPLILPQIGLVFGIYVQILLLNVNGSVLGIVLAQIIFVLPYCFIVLANAWKSFDNRYAVVGASLGHSYFVVLWRIKFQLLLRPVLFTWALALAISFNLYLPALYVGEGRVPTLVTELVILGSNYDRRMIGVYASWMALCPLIAFLLAVVIPRLVHGKYQIEH